MGDLFTRNVDGMTAALRGCRIAIAGCGGLGSNAAVSLARAGVGSLILADFDVVEISNLNRQHFFQKDIGRLKTEALADHLRAINPEIKLDMHSVKIDAANTARIFGAADLLIEAFDRAEAKMMLIGAWCTSFAEKPIVCGNGLSGLGQSDQLKLLQAGQVYFCGDGTSDMSAGLCSARVALVANMQANAAIELIVRGSAT
ncbi:MAG: sulfur carrier protein ThiS adenylyltransferase ThiF [bacterium]|nr:sulfur carrier protein ThiS adenylyltransferase ThiF [bacterium]